MVESKYSTSAYDGLSLAGKSTMVEMLHQRSNNSVVVRENKYDPIRPITSETNKMLKKYCDKPEFVKDVLIQQIKNHKEHKGLFEEILEEYENKWKYEYTQEKCMQACLARMFTQGRKIVDEKTSYLKESNNLIYDRWQISGWAYQSSPSNSKDDKAFTWREIKQMNEELDIGLPDMQFILTCPIEDIQKRREFRHKVGYGTAGQMSKGREEIIYNAFLEINPWLSDKIPNYMIENEGIPTEDMKKQIEQSIPIYVEIENTIRNTLKDWSLKEPFRDAQAAREYFLDDKNLHQIGLRQAGELDKI